MILLIESIFYKFKSFKLKKLANLVKKEKIILKPIK